MPLSLMPVSGTYTVIMTPTGLAENVKDIYAPLYVLFWFLWVINFIKIQCVIFDSLIQSYAVLISLGCTQSKMIHSSEKTDCASIRQCYKYMTIFSLYLSNYCIYGMDKWRLRRLFLSSIGIWAWWYCVARCFFHSKVLWQMRCVSYYTCCFLLSSWQYSIIGVSHTYNCNILLLSHRDK